MKKRIVSLLLTLCMVFTMLPVTALAAAVDIEITDVEYYSTGALKSVTTEFGWDTGSATGRLVLQSKRLRSAGEEGTSAAYGDFTNFGYYGSSFDSFDEVLEYDAANGTFDIVSSSDETAVQMGKDDHSVTFAFDASDMPLDKNGLYYIYFWTWYSSNYYPDNLFMVIQVKDGAVSYTPATGRNEYDESAFEEIVTEETYDVTVTPGANMTLVSGSESQTDLNGSMTPVVYTANAGYEFPADYAVTAVNGIMVRRDSASQISVLGKPTADAAITLTDASVAAPVVPSEVELLNDGWPYGKDMTSSSVTLTVAVSDASNATFEWYLEAADGEDQKVGSGKELTLSNPVSGSRYYCVVNGELTSETVEIVKPDDSWTKPSSSYYITNGTIAYMVNGEIFDVVGRYVVGENTYMINTSYGRNWDMYSSSDAEPEADSVYGDDGNARLDDLWVAFDADDTTAVYFRADLADGQQAFAFGCDTQLASGKIVYSDSAALIASLDNGVLQHVAMIGAKSEAEAKATDASFVIAPNGAAASRFWLGYYSSRQAYAYNSAFGTGYRTTNIGGTDVTTAVEDHDSGMTMSWLNVPAGGTVDFLFKVGKVADTGAAEPVQDATVTFHANGHGTAPEAQTVTIGDTAEEPAAPTETGYTFGGWYTDEACTTAWDFETAVTEDLDLYAKWTVNVYDIIYNEEGGEIQGQYPETYTYGVAVTLPTEVRRLGFIFRGWLDADGEVITEIAAGTVGDVEVTAKWVLNPIVLVPILGGNDPKHCSRGSSCPIYDFTDADTRAWYHDGVHYALDKGLMNGVGDGKFAPNAATSRAMVVTILYRLEGAPAASTQKVFSDVSYNSWYGAAVSWAAANGIVEGYEDGTFRPNTAITREQLAAILYRYAAYAGDWTVDYYVDSVLGSFGDSGTISGYAVKAMNWAVAEGLINGMDGALNPRGTATRAQAAAILYRFLEK